jgi:two-component system, OmpR family, sensor kinase
VHTPPIRRRLTGYTLVGFAAVLLVFDIFLYTSLRNGLEDALADLLRSRAELAEDLGAALEPEELAQELTAIGIPAVIRTPEGEEYAASPVSPRYGPTPPGPITSLQPPLTSRTVTLEDGTRVAVFASSAGVQQTLQRLLVFLAIGSLAALLLAWFLLRRLVDSTLDPLETVVETAERIAAGEHGERLQPDRPGTELGRMASSFDDMVDALEGAIERAWAEEERTRRFLGDAAHQLRTPLSGVRAAAELLLSETDLETRDRLLAHLVRETARTSNLISDLLHIARLDQQRPMLAEPTDLVALIEDEVSRSRDHAPHLEFAVEVNDVPAAPVAVDPAEVRTALANLLANARRFAEGTIRVDATVDDQRFFIRVVEDGPGLRDGEDELVFERFSTLDGGGGSGLGLPIVRGVSRAHGGDAYFDGEGFVIELPLHRGEEDADSDGYADDASEELTRTGAPQR